MAYSDYGGYALLNGVRVEERSDAVLIPEDLLEVQKGMSIQERTEMRFSHPNGHVVLGDERAYVGLYKTGLEGIWVDRIKKSVLDFPNDLDERYVDEGFDSKTRMVSEFAICLLYTSDAADE